MNNRIMKVALSAILSGVALSANAGSPTYTFTDLGTLGGTFSVALGINTAGQVVGYANDPNSVYDIRAVVWNGTTATNLGTLNGTNTSMANAINSSGQIAGYAVKNVGSIYHPIVWNGTTATDLGVPSGTISYANGINDSGQVAGTAIADNIYRAVVWNGTTATNLGTLGGTRSEAYGINASGQVVGYAQTANNINHAVVWNGTTATDLDPLSGLYNSYAYAINASGQVVGNSSFAPTGANPHATLWNGTTATDLGTLGGSWSIASAINTSGQIVGYAQTAGNVYHAALWNGTLLTDLNSFLTVSEVSAGWVLKSATGINDNGWIVGIATNSLLGISNHAFVMSVTPVSEPETLGMMLMGLGLMGFVANRRRDNHA